MKFFKRFLDASDNQSIKFLLIWIVFLSVSYCFLSVLRHNQFQSGAFDLGIFDQAVWQYANFEFPYNTIKERFILGDHFTLTLPLLAPLYWFWDDVRALLIFQAFFVTFSSLAIYEIARIRKLKPLSSLIIAIVFSLFYGIQTAIYFDFHPIVIAVGLLAWTAFFFESKKWKLFWLTLILLLLTQENTGIAFAGLGLIYFFHKEYRKISIAFILGGIGVSLLEARIVAMFSPVGYQYSPIFPSSILGYFTGYFDSPEKLENWKYSLVPLGFLPIFSIGAMMAVLLDLAQYYLTGLDRMWTPYQHHRAILSVFFILGLIDVLVYIKDRRIINVNYLVLGVLLLTIVSQYMFHFPLNKLSKKSYWVKESWVEDNNRIIGMVSKDASVAAPQNIVPHLSHRKEIYLVWPRKQEVGELCPDSCWWLDFSGRPEYLVVDLRPNQWITQLLESNENFSEAVKNMEKAGKIKLEHHIEDARLYKINY